MNKLLFALLFVSLPVFAASKSVISTSTTPTVINLNSPPTLTIEVTVGVGDTCLVEFSATPGSGTSGGNWQPVSTLNLITANATQSLSSQIQAIRITRTAGTNTCQMDLEGSF